jgi:hypothetical protein
MKKLDKKTIKNLVLEAIGTNPTRIVQPTKIFAPTLGDEKIRNFPNGEKPDNSRKEEQYRREPYLTGPVETHIKDGEIYVTQGKNQFKLVFTNESLTSGFVMPIGEFGFHINGGMVEWNDSTPMNVTNDTNLEKQILDYSGREK